jgi:RimJ/RimL family protein N-acetyltransferase
MFRGVPQDKCFCEKVMVGKMLNKEILLKNGRICVLRQAEEQDAGDILEYMNYVCGETDFLALGRGDIDWTVEKERKFIRDHLDSENKLLVVAEVQGSINGIIGFAGDEKKRMQHTGEFGVIVSQKYWSIGLGSALVEYMIEWAKNSGIVRKINLRVRVDNQRALRLYERFGFTREGLVSRQFKMADKFYDAYFLGLHIDP